MGYNRSAGKRISIAAVVACSLSAMAQAEPVDTIFAAENALYGAGFDIGEADGWMDQSLQAAIRRFQSSISGLQATGNLDQATLTALGIASDGTTVSNNTLANARAAKEALGLLPEQNRPGAVRTSRATSRPDLSSAPAPRPAPRPAPSPAPSPEPAPVPEPEPQQARQTEPKAEIPSQATDTFRFEAPKPVAKAEEPAPTTTRRATSEQPKAVPTREPAAQPEPKPEPKARVATRPEPAPSPAPRASNQPTEAEMRASAADADEAQARANFEEPESDPGEQSSSARKEMGEPGRSIGLFFNWIFDALFGWI